MYEPKPKPTSQSNKSNKKPTTTSTIKNTHHTQNFSVHQTFTRSEKSNLHSQFKSGIFDREVSFMVLQQLLPEELHRLELCDGKQKT